jgi:hypothetical protein
MDIILVFPDHATELSQYTHRRAGLCQWSAPMWYSSLAILNYGFIGVYNRLRQPALNRGTNDDYAPFL